MKESTKILAEGFALKATKANSSLNRSFHVLKHMVALSKTIPFWPHHMVQQPTISTSLKTFQLKLRLAYSLFFILGCECFASVNFICALRLDTTTKVMECDFLQIHMCMILLSLTLFCKFFSNNVMMAMKDM